MPILRRQLAASGRRVRSISSGRGSRGQFRHRNPREPVSEAADRLGPCRTPKSLPSCVIDGHSLAFRAFYALPIDSFTTRDGQHTNAIHGFISMLLLLLQQQKPTHLAVAFDVSRESFRTREYPEYKGTRGETPPEFKGQIPLLQEALGAMGIHGDPQRRLRGRRHPRHARPAGAPNRASACCVASGDRDTFQLVNDDVTVLYPNVRGVSELKTYDADAVRERYGIEPRAVSRGRGARRRDQRQPDRHRQGRREDRGEVDPSSTAPSTTCSPHADEIKGVVGAEPARPAGPRDPQPQAEPAASTDVELPVEPCRPRPPADRRAGRARPVRPAAVQDAARSGVQDRGRGRRPGAARRADRDDHRRARGAQPRRRRARLLARSSARQPVGVRITTLNGQVDAVGPRDRDRIGRAVGAASTPDPALDAWLASTRPEVRARRRSALTALLPRGRHRARRGRLRHLPGAWLLRPSRRRSTRSSSLIYYYLGETLPEPDPNQLVPATDAVSPATEAWYVVRLADDLRARLDEGSLERARATSRSRSCPVLARMERQGVTVSAPVLAELNGRLGAEAAEIAPRAYAEIGREVNLGSPKQLQEVLFDQLAMPKTRANKTGYSTDAQSLADLEEQNPHPFLGHAAAASRCHQDPPDRRDPREGHRPRRAHPHHATSRPAPRPGGCRRTTRTCRTSRSRPRWAARSGRRSRWARGSRPCSPPTTRRSRCASWRTSPKTRG